MLHRSGRSCGRRWSLVRSFLMTSVWSSKMEITFSVEGTGSSLMILRCVVSHRVSARGRIRRISPRIRETLADVGGGLGLKPSKQLSRHAEQHP